jgi:PAS domain S-box-containing protein
MPKKSDKSQEQLLAENEDLRVQLDKTEETLRYILSGEADALIVLTEQGKQLYTLKGADRSYRILIEEMNEGALTLTAEGMILFANRGFAEILKTPLEKVIGSMIQTWITPDSQSIFQTLLRKGGNEKRREQLSLTASDGTLVPVSLSASSLLINEMPASFCLVATDLTEQKRSDAIAASEKITQELLAASTQSRLALLSVIEDQKQTEAALLESEKEFHSLAEAMPQMVWITRPDGWNIYFNQQWVDFTGQTLEESYGHGWNKPFHPDDQQRAWDAWQNATRTGTTYSLECRLRRADGIYRWWLIRGVPQLDTQGNILKWFGTCTDINEIKRAEEEISLMNAELEQRVEERTRELHEAQEQLVRKEKLAVLGQIAGSMSHELRNPLGVINTAIYYLKTVQPDAGGKIKRYHAIIQQEVHNAEKIISDLLNFVSNNTAERKPVSIPELVQRVIERFPVPASVEVKLEIPADLPMVFVDPRQVEQVLGNLVTNAYQAMASASSATGVPTPGTGSSTVVKISGKLEVISDQSAERTPSSWRTRSSEWVRIRVKDTGTGISPENMPKLFEPLFTTKAKGIGLGLAVSRKLAEANSGRIEVESEVGKGSTFTLVLPVVTQERWNV